jgi:hypothetical protein
MSIPRLTILFAAAAVGASGLAAADTPATQQKTFESYQPYLEAPVEDFMYWSIYKWQLAGPDKVVVWPRTNEAYMLTVEQPCKDLQWSHGIGFTAKQMHHVTRRIDYLRAGKDRCRVIEIRPIDTKKMDQDRGISD